MRTECYPLRVLLQTVSGFVNRHQAEVIAYLVEENQILKDQMKGRRVRLTDDYPHSLPLVLLMTLSPVLASSPELSVRTCARIIPVRSTPRCNLRQPRFPCRPCRPCLAAAHSPSPTIDNPVLSMIKWAGVLAR
ncbi:MAG: hypothetical protein ACI9K5_001631 [Gammaproteobacteria bacterium]|jgi:hypothetical protein